LGQERYCKTGKGKKEKTGKGEGERQDGEGGKFRSPPKNGGQMSEFLERKEVSRGCHG